MSLGDDLDLKPLFDVSPLSMRNSDYHVEVWPYLLGQFRIMLMKAGTVDIVRQACTYQMDRMARVVVALVLSEDPPAYLESLARPWNCEFPGDRIRLDNHAPDEAPPAAP